jgi:biuret amidohydrolase
VGCHWRERPGARDRRQHRPPLPGGEGTAKARGIAAAVSPHYYYPTDHGWHFEGPLEKLMHKIGMFDRKGALTLDGFRRSGADFLDEYKAFIEDGETIVTSPHKVYGVDFR